MRTRAITIIVPIILFAAACPISAADPNMAGEQKQQQSMGRKPFGSIKQVRASLLARPT